MYIRWIQKEKKWSTKLDILQQLFNIYFFIFLMNYLSSHFNFYIWGKLKTISITTYMLKNVMRSIITTTTTSSTIFRDLGEQLIVAFFYCESLWKRCWSRNILVYRIMIFDSCESNRWTFTTTHYEGLNTRE